MRVLTCLLLMASTALAQQPATRPATTQPATIAEAHRIVFLLDTTRISNFMLGKVKEELNLSVDHFRDNQMFTIIIARPQGQVPRMLSLNPTRAGKVAKEEAKDFVRTIDGETNPYTVAAIRKAVELQPDLLFYVVVDTTPDSDAIRLAFRPLHGCLNIVWFTSNMAHPEEFLRTLALEHGGIGGDCRIPNADLHFGGVWGSELRSDALEAGCVSPGFGARSRTNKYRAPKPGRLHVSVLNLLSRQY